MGLAFGGAGCGGSQPSQMATRDVRLSGTVGVCPPNFGKCSLTAATVTLLTVHGTVFGSSVGKEYAANGPFSFLVAPGKYLPPGNGNTGLCARC
jgi:hypothetical protein